MRRSRRCPRQLQCRGSAGYVGCPKVLLDVLLDPVVHVLLQVLLDVVIQMVRPDVIAQMFGTGSLASGDIRSGRSVWFGGLRLGTRGTSRRLSALLRSAGPARATFFLGDDFDRRLVRPSFAAELLQESIDFVLQPGVAGPRWLPRRPAGYRALLFSSRLQQLFHEQKNHHDYNEPRAGIDRQQRAEQWKCHFTVPRSRCEKGRY